MKSILKKAFNELFPNNNGNYSFNLNYSNRFNKFNSNIRRNGNQIEVNLSSSWKEIGEEVKIGLIQYLLMKLFKKHKDTIYTQLYNDFIKKLDKFTPVEHLDEILKKSFERINIKYFSNILEICNLKWGKYSTRQLGIYNFQTDTITISSIFKNEDPECLDFIMYHELLHKKEKFENKNGKSRYHTSKFKKLEKKFENYEEINKKIEKTIIKFKKTKQKSILSLFKF